MIDLAAIEDWHFWFVGRDAVVLALLDRHLGASTGGAIADVGCGTGAFAGRLANRDRLVVAMDHQRPTKAGGAAAAIADAEVLPLRDHSVEVVLARDVLEHVDEGRALAECHRVLQPGGVLVALVPAWPRLWSDRDDRAGHLRRYTRRQVREAVRAGGFDVIELRGYQFFLLPLVGVSRILARRRPASTLRAEERPASALNSLLRTINLVEARFARRRWPNPPTGSTLVVVAQAR